MTSILTNIAAMAALQTLRSVDKQMETTQSRVSSGLRVNTASDNAAYWSIATTMRSDNMALSAVTDALGLGAAKIDTAYAAMQSVVDVVKQIKAKLVAATEAGVDKSKIQEEIKQLQQQIKSISESASFSGENWLQADISGATNNAVTKRVIGSFTRDPSGGVKVQSIEFVLDSTTVLFDTNKSATTKLGLADSNAKLDKMITNVDIATAVPLTVTGEALAAGGATLSITSNSNINVYTTAGGDTYVRSNQPIYGNPTAPTVITGYGPSYDANGKELWVKAKYVTDAVAAVPATAPVAPNNKAATGASNNPAAVTDQAATPYATVAGDGAPFAGPGKFYIQTQPDTKSYGVASTTTAALTKADTDDANISIAFTGALATITTVSPAGTETYIKLGTQDAWVKAAIGTPATAEYNAAGEKGVLIGSNYYFIDKTNTKAPGNVQTDLGVSLSDLDVTKMSDIASKMGTGTTAAQALDYMVQFVNNQLEQMISSTSKLGSISMRIGLQEDFVSKLTNSIDKGIGRLVDANMNEESTKLKALQTQQQLAIQALSIANTSSQNILSLFK